MRSAFTLLAARRLTGVGTALAVEAAILLALAQANSSAVVGIPAAVAAAIAGTVAVVFGPVDGVLVSLAGAAVFGLATSWKAGTLAALVVWPAIVFAVGLFARRVERGRTGLEQIVAAQELERQRLALELHDETAQTLVAALIALRHDEQQAGSAEQGSSAATSRALIEATIQAVRRLAVDLRPKVLDDFGLVPAVERLAETLSERTGISVDVDGRGWTARLPGEIELALYRTVQEALANSAGRDLHAVRIVLEQKTGKAAVAVETDGFGDGTDAGVGLEGLRERLRLLDGRLAVAPRGAGRTTLRAEVPIRAESSRVAVTRGRARA
jgi:signal transduction histidine kinase